MEYPVTSYKMIRIFGLRLSNIVIFHDTHEDNHLLQLPCGFCPTNTGWWRCCWLCLVRISEVLRTFSPAVISNQDYLFTLNIFLSFYHIFWPLILYNVIAYVTIKIFHSIASKHNIYCGDGLSTKAQPISLRLCADFEHVQNIIIT